MTSLEITPSPLESKKRKFSDSKSLERRVKRKKSKFEYNMVIPSLSVQDITPLLDRFHLYKTEEEKHILCHGDFITKFNNCITPIDENQNLYLMKYRYYAPCAINMSIFDFYKENLRNQKYQTQWDATLNKLKQLLPVTTLVEIIQQYKPRNIDKLMEFLKDANVKMAVFLTVVRYNDDFLEYFADIDVPLDVAIASAMENKETKSLIPFDDIISLYKEFVDTWKSYEMSFGWYKVVDQLVKTSMSNLKMIPWELSIDKIFATRMLGNDTNQHVLLDIFAHIYRFNPKDDEQILDIVKRVKRNPSLSPFHPIYYKWASVDEDLIGAGFCILKIAIESSQSSSVKIQMVRNFMQSCYYSGFEGYKCLRYSSDLDDCRILKMPFDSEKIDNLQVYSFTVSSDCQVKPLRYMCIGTMYLLHNLEEKEWFIRFSDKDEPTTNVPCYLTSNSDVKFILKNGYGRNWTVFWRDNQLFASYQFLPHVVFEILGNSQCVVATRAETKSNYADFFTFTGNRYQFSLGSPAMVFNDTEYIAVGHSRFNRVQEYGQSPITTRKFSDFDTKYNEFVHEPVMNQLYDYFMYFYTFDRKTFTITRLSYSFVLETSEPYLLEFAIGLCRINKDMYCISYGEGDVRAKLAFMSHQDIDSLLLPIETITKNPQEYQFARLTST